MARLDDVAALLDFSASLTVLRQQLAAYPFDYTGEAVPLLRSHFDAVLRRYLLGDLTASDVEAWAEAIELREDVDYDDERDPFVHQMLFWLANPLINGALTPDTARDALNLISRDIR